uniref:Uncharacterized protein n=1 Tax=Caenorhabditis tropicalis TaxID=1561998 RepID=A0A1I7U787_9PELO
MLCIFCPETWNDRCQNSKKKVVSFLLLFMDHTSFEIRDFQIGYLKATDQTMINRFQIRIYGLRELET